MNLAHDLLEEIKDTLNRTSSVYWVGRPLERGYRFMFHAWCPSYINILVSDEGIHVTGEFGTRGPNTDIPINDPNIDIVQETIDAVLLIVKNTTEATSKGWV